VVFSFARYVRRSFSLPHFIGYSQMSSEFLSHLAPLLLRCQNALKLKPELQSELLQLARSFTKWLEDQQDATAPSSQVSASHPVLQQQPPPLPPGYVHEFLAPVPSYAPRVSMAPSAPTPGYDTAREFIPLPLSTVVARCRVKAAAAKLVTKRVAGATLAETEADEEKIRKQAEAIPDCGLWMFDGSGMKQPKALWDDLTGGYTVCASAAELLKIWMAQGPDLSTGQEVLLLCAEAQSMLLYAVSDLAWVNRDHEQVQLFVHIRELGKIHQIYVPRFLRREDPADPSKWPDLLQRLAKAIVKFGGGLSATVSSNTNVDTLTPLQTPALPADPAKVRAKALGNLRFKLRKLSEQDDAPLEEWPRMVELLEQAVQAGVPPSSLELREMLVPVFSRLPRDLEAPAPVERVFRAIELHLESLKTDDEPLPELNPSDPEIAATAELLRGKELVFIGGLRRSHHINALKKAFSLSDVRWLSTPEHTSFTVFEADIARSEVAVVVLAIRWSSHDYASVQQYCTRYGKPLVRLKAGYNPSQVAHAILEQVSDKLKSNVAEGFAAGL
jgi:hypothetical protein